jgi:H3 lysine-79-specific histone-lysine N-methyltransferase
MAVNEALKPKFLDLKEGAIVVSLKPFVSSIHARVTERNVRVRGFFFFHNMQPLLTRLREKVDDMSAIFDVTERPYHSGSVSWGPLGGTYYLHRVDREGYAAIRQKFEDSTALGRHHRKRR